MTPSDGYFFKPAGPVLGPHFSWHGRQLFPAITALASIVLFKLQDANVAEIFFVTVLI